MALLVAPTRTPNRIFCVLMQLYYVKILISPLRNHRPRTAWPPEGFDLGDHMLDQPALRADIVRAIRDNADGVIPEEALDRKLAIVFTRLFLARAERLSPSLVLKCNSDIGLANVLRLAMDADAILQPLRSITRNGLVIAECPRTAAGLELLEENTIDKILADLGWSSTVEGATLQDKRQTIRGKWIDYSFSHSVQSSPQTYSWFWGTGYLDVDEARGKVCMPLGEEV
ncbi:hypothetical protein TCAP_07300 [Tolypocladium capitatum]|uniref:Uncharacterized protein n=1 Tax=Tolypocladium capitatum TaxID=45235 RepID=A0A2K3Q033_9HYPO|nr:hypothetical protein TCAP_07300 [Tolypocladium capitatum]